MAPQIRAKAAVRAEVMNWGLGDAHVDPGEVLLRLVSQSAARAEHYAALLRHQYELAENGAENSDLSEKVLVLVGYEYALTREGESVPVKEAIRGLVLLEGMERDRCANFAAKAIAAGLAERQVKLAERQGALIADVLRAVLGDPSLGLSLEQQSAVPAVIRRHLEIAV